MVKMIGRAGIETPDPTVNAVTSHGVKPVVLPSPVKINWGGHSRTSSRMFCQAFEALDVGK
jgi:hypothetical protein